MALFRGIQEYIVLDANNIVSISEIYSCIPLKDIQYYIIIIHTEFLVAKIKSCIPRAL